MSGWNVVPPEVLVARTRPGNHPVSCPPLVMAQCWKRQRDVEKLQIHEIKTRLAAQYRQHSVATSRPLGQIQALHVMGCVGAGADPEAAPCRNMLIHKVADLAASAVTNGSWWVGGDKSKVSFLFFFFFRRIMASQRSSMVSPKLNTRLAFPLPAGVHMKLADSLSPAGFSGHPSSKHR